LNPEIRRSADGIKIRSLERKLSRFSKTMDQSPLAVDVDASVAILLDNCLH